MARSFIVLCEGDLRKFIMRDDKVSAPEADPKPIIAGTVPGTYATAEIAEQAIIGFNCPEKHYIVEAMHVQPLKL